MSKQKNREKACKDCGTKVKSNMRYCEKCWLRRKDRLGRNKLYRFHGGSNG